MIRQRGTRLQRSAAFFSLVYFFSLIHLSPPPSSSADRAPGPTQTRLPLLGAVYCLASQTKLSQKLLPQAFACAPYQEPTLGTEVLSFKKLLATSNDSTLAFMRVMLGIVFFSHGAQKVLGWFGGYGFSGTMGFFTTQLHIPAPLALLAICAELFGSLGLIVGFLTRIAAFGIAFEMLVAILMVHIHMGFFMNWYGNQKGEGFEYHLLTLALAIPIMIRGAGAFSIDRALSSKSTV
jgi:putative oxidoreductase